MRGRGRGSGLLAALACVALLAGCSGVPSSGPARAVRRVPRAEPPEPRVIRQLPANPPADARPDDIVRGFLIAQNLPADGYAVARRYLAPQQQWETGARTVVYSTRELRPPRLAGDRASVVVRLATLGVISETGEYRARSAPVDVTFRLRQVPDLGWRLAEPPPGLLLTRDGVAASFLRTTLYWPDQARRLVPDPVFLRADEQPVAAVVRALLAGPRGWIAPAVRSAIPKGTELLRPPELADGVVTLNFSREFRGAARETLATLVAQVVWTVTERPEAGVVRLLAEGEPLNVAGRPGAPEHRRADWGEFAPVPETADRRLFFVRNAAPYALDDEGRLTRVTRTAPLVSVAVNRAGTTLAGVTRPAAGRQSLVLVDLTGERRPRSALTADRVTAPTWEPGGDAVWAVQSTGRTQQVVAVPVDSGLFDGVPLPASLPGPIVALRLSPDGARAVAVVGPEGRETLWLLRVERRASGGPVLGEPLRVVPGVRGVTAVTFDGAGDLLFAVRGARRPALFRVGVDGYGLEPVRDAGLPAGPVTALASSGSVPTARIAASDRRLWRRTPADEWTPLRAGGSAPTYAG